MARDGIHAAEFMKYLKTHLAVGGVQGALEWLAAHIGNLNGEIERLNREIGQLKRARTMKAKAEGKPNG
jgi:hypothetical protein